MDTSHARIYIGCVEFDRWGTRMYVTYIEGKIRIDDTAGHAHEEGQGQDTTASPSLLPCISPSSARLARLPARGRIQCSQAAFMPRTKCFFVVAMWHELNLLII